MRLGFYATILLAPTISLLWNHLYGHLHPYFSTVTWFFCAGSLLVLTYLILILNQSFLKESAMEIIICRSMLSFNYRVVAVSEVNNAYKKKLISLWLSGNLDFHKDHRSLWIDQF